MTRTCAAAEACTSVTHACAQVGPTLHAAAALSPVRNQPVRAESACGMHGLNLQRLTKQPDLTDVHNATCSSQTEVSHYP
jgi:hypothetical protein